MSKIINCKVVILGDSSTGKSSIVNRYVNNQFDEISEATIGASFLKKDIHFDNYTITHEIWDTAGQERYRSLAPMYYRNAKVGIVVFDMTNKESFLSAIEWIKELKEMCADIIIRLVGNKIDLPNHIDKNLINEYVNSHNLDFLTCSAKENLNISDIFENLSADISCKKNDIESVNLEQISKPKKINCC